MALFEFHIHNHVDTEMIISKLNEILLAVKSESDDPELREKIAIKLDSIIDQIKKIIPNQ